MHCPNITAPIDDATMLGMRHAYQAAVSWMDEQIGSVLAELDSLGLTATTLVLLHGDQYVTSMSRRTFLSSTHSVSPCICSGWHLGEGNSWHKVSRLLCFWLN